MSRRDFFNDPDAPAARSRVPGVSVAVVRLGRDLLLTRRVDNGLWVLPGGALELGETAEQAGVREVLEETGIRCRVTHLRGIYTDPGHVIAYSDGTVLQEFAVVLRAEHVGGDLQVQASEASEASEAAWVPIAELARFPLHRAMRARIERAIDLDLGPVLA